MTRNLAAAFFLASSWFWCIGGFFPMLIVRDFGPEVFFFFFAFNTIGAAAFGFAWSNERRLEFLSRHEYPAQLFSLVVAGYHLIFVSWLTTLLGNIFVLAAYLLATAAFWGLRRKLFGLSVGLFVLTALLFAFSLSQPGAERAVNPAPASYLHGVLPLALGFLLAPYFDLTFHRAYARSPSPRISFALGFIVFFGALLIGVWFSIGRLEALISPDAAYPAGLGLLVGLLVLQFAFTTAAHLSELAEAAPLPARQNLIAATLVSGLVAAHFAVALLAPDLRIPLGLLVYRSFVFVIGGLFPLLILYRWDRRFILAGAAIMVPCYSLGFLIGGSFVPFLSLAMAGLAGLWLIQRRLAG